MSKDTNAPTTLAIGFPAEQVSSDRAAFFRRNTVKGYDLILLDARNFLRLEGLAKLSSSDHEAIGGYIKRRVAELHQWIERGSVLVVHPARGFQAKTEDGEVYNYALETFDEAWDELHLGIRLVVERGTQFEAATEPFQKFLDATVATGLQLVHHVIIRLGPYMVAGLKIPGTDDVVACAARLGEGEGLVLFLPNARLDQRQGFNAFRDATWQLAQDLRDSWPKEDVTEPMPDWADDYPLPGEDGLVADLGSTDDEIVSLRNKFETLRGQLADRRRDKHLFTAMGNDLEDAVEEALTDLGFRVEKPEEFNRTDRIAWDGERAVVLEIKGREKGALSRHLGQVMNWKGEFYSRHERAADAAMLIVNGWRKLPLDKRSDKAVFEPNIVSDAEREGIGLMTGVQVLGLKIAVESDDLGKEEARKRIFDCRGQFEGFEKLEKRPETPAQPAAPVAASGQEVD